MKFSEVYYKNALAVISGIDASAFPRCTRVPDHATPPSPCLQPGHALRGPVLMGQDRSYASTPTSDQTCSPHVALPLQRSPKRAAGKLLRNFWRSRGSFDIAVSSYRIGRRSTISGPSQPALRLAACTVRLARCCAIDASLTSAIL